MNDPYEVLGLRQGASEEEVKKALIKLKYEELFEFMFKINHLSFLFINKNTKAHCHFFYSPKQIPKKFF